MLLLPLLLSVIAFTWAYTGPTMGVVSECDFAKPGIDWDTADTTPYTCIGGQWPLPKGGDVKMYEIPNFNATADRVAHKCMNTSISYPDSPPLRGDHRPNWGVYGEYLYIPEQRWLHNLEHGSIVMLYHPCADPGLVNAVRTIVNNCLYRHVITPYNNLTKEYPVNLISWGAKLEIGSFDQGAIVNFIKNHARHSPEDTSKQGLYDSYVIHPSQVVAGSNINDTKICPSY